MASSPGGAVDFSYKHVLEIDKKFIIVLLDTYSFAKECIAYKIMLSGIINTPIVVDGCYGKVVIVYPWNATSIGF